MNPVVLCMPLFLAAAPPVAAPVEGVPLGKIIAGLVDDLGAERYDVRERASMALRRVGLPALAALEKAAESDDPEIRVRARQILGDVRLGISPDWPAEIALLVRHYERLNDGERHQALQRLTAAVGDKAVPFLVLRLGKGSSREANTALQHLYGLNKEAAWKQVIRLLPEPETDGETRALAWARAQSGQAIEALELLARSEIKDTTHNKAIEAGVEKIRLLLVAHDADGLKQAATLAERFARVAPTDARFLYLRAEALAALDKDAAAALRKQALALNPDAEAPHYTAGEMLGKLGRRRLAAAEWQRILDIDPKDGVYDINACLRLSSIHAATGRFESAAQYLEKAFELYTKAKQASGSGMGIVGGTVESIQVEIRRLREKAARTPAPPDAKPSPTPAPKPAR
ncbi:MAG: hypothetical protein ISS72_01205 [Candidatus Brocadiae bacterium]|nr:hypothetical protein [Candidatus Brocadiia bacterium]